MPRLSISSSVISSPKTFATLARLISSMSTRYGLSGSPALPGTRA